MAPTSTRAPKATALPASTKFVIARPKRPRKPKPFAFAVGATPVFSPCSYDGSKVWVHGNYWRKRDLRRLRNWLTRWLEWQEGQR